MSLDPTTGELFVPVGNPWPDIDKAYRPGANLFTNSIVVLDARTGALKWWHQVAPADWQDLDLAAAPVLYRDSKIRDLRRVRRQGRLRHRASIATRTSWCSARRSRPSSRRRKNPDDAKAFAACPGYAGGVEWNGPALDRLNNHADHRRRRRVLHREARHHGVQSRAR